MNKRSFSSFSKRGGSKFKKRDYKNREFKNPFFQNKKRSFSQGNLISILSLIKNKLTIIIISAIMLVGLYFLFFSNFFTIQNVNLNGLTRTNYDDVLEIINNQRNQKKFFVFNQSNILVFSKSKLIKNLDNKYDFAKIEIEKDYPANLNINIQEKSLALIWLEEEKYYNTDIDGYIISEVGALDIKKDIYPIIENRRGKLINGNQINFNQKEIDYSLKLFSEFINNTSGIKIEKFILDNDLNTVKVKSTEGPEIYFNIDEDIDKQIEKLIIIKNEKLKDDFPKKTYIDLRYGDRVYYR